MKAITVEEFILNSGPWMESLNMLREIMLALGMEENLKWGTPIYSFNGSNVVGIGHFKLYTGLWFYQGVFLKDTMGKLMAAEENTRALRQWRFYSADEIESDLELIIEYMEEAIDNARKGKKIKPLKKKEYKIPEELREQFLDDSSLRTAFESLSHSKKWEFCTYINQAKRPETRKKRMDKCIPMIREGKGLLE